MIFGTLIDFAFPFQFIYIYKPLYLCKLPLGAWKHSYFSNSPEKQHPHFIGGDTEAQRGLVVGSKSHME